jgi:adenosylcobinamide-phosphate synthase
MRSELAAVFVLALAIDRVFGEPPDRFHPTVFMGKTIELLEKRSMSGAFIFFAVTLGFSLPVFFVVEFFDGAAKVLLAALILKTSFSWKGLSFYTLPIAKALDSKDIDKAREKVPFIAGRNPDQLDENDILSTAVESIAESSTDGIISPLFYFFVCSFLSLETAVAAAVFYRAVNTLDSMLGQPENPKGYLSAKADELLNFMPSRIAAVLLLFSGFVLRKNTRRGFAVFRRDRAATPSKNAGQTMSVMAGLLGVQLQKKGFYTLGDPIISLKTGHIYEALKIVDVLVIVFALLMVVFWI